MTEPASPAALRIFEMDYAAHAADAAERVKIQASIADRALQSLMLANGGAMVALFTFAGNLAKTATPSVHFDGGHLKLAFGFFVAGLALALFAHMFAFASQDRFHHVSAHEAKRAQDSILAGAAVVDQAEAKKAFRQGSSAYLFGLATFAASALAFVGGSGIALWAVA